MNVMEMENVMVHSMPVIVMWDGVVQNVKFLDVLEKLKIVHYMESVTQQIIFVPVYLVSTIEISVLLEQGRINELLV